MENNINISKNWLTKILKTSNNLSIADQKNGRKKSDKSYRVESITGLHSEGISIFRSQEYTVSAFLPLSVNISGDGIC